MPTDACLFFSTIITLLVACLLVQQRSKFHDAKQQDPRLGIVPKLPGIGLLGYKYVFNIVRYRRSFLLDVVAPQFALGGPTHECTIFNHRYVFTAEPRNIASLLHENFENFETGSTRITAFGPFWGDKVIFHADGAPWQHRRRLLQPFLNLNLEAKLADIEKRLDILFEKLKGSTATGSRCGSVEITATLRSFIGDFLANMITGTSLPSRTDTSHATVREFHRACDLGLGWASLRIFSPLPWPAYGQFKEACRTVRNHTLPAAQASWNKVRVMQQGKQQPKQENLFAEAAAHIVQNPEDLANEILGVLIAGTDSIASTLSFAIILLAQRPAFASELRCQVLEKFGKDPRNLADTSQLTAFQPLVDVINEVLRLYPPIPLNFRVAKRQCVLPTGAGPDGTQSFTVQAGQTVAFCPFVLHRRKDIWGEDAEEFRPRRWQGYRPSDSAFIPFNGGYRPCLGKKLALAETSYILGRILQEFEHFKILEGNGMVQEGDDHRYPMPGFVVYLGLRPSRSFVHLS